MALPIVDRPVDRLKRVLAERPLYLLIETTNICNARCVFCAYPKMKREKAVMSPELFAKVIRDYVEMGGGAVGLTPIVGDVLLDPQLPQRLRLLRGTPGITHVSFTTNGIAWERFQPAARRFIAESLNTICFSLGGVDARSYRQMFAVDRFEKVRRAIDDVCEIKAARKLPLQVHLYFRVNRPMDELLRDPNMQPFRRPEIESISGINRFGNWGGLIREDDLPVGARLIPLDGPLGRLDGSRKQPCFVHYLSPEITVNGLVSACGCMNAEATELILGDVREHHLRDIWRGEAAQRLRASYGSESMPSLCKQCTYYEDGERFLAQPALGRFRVGDNPWELLSRENDAAANGRRLAAVVTGLLQAGDRRVVLYGAGNATRLALMGPEGDRIRSSVVAVIDDDVELAGGEVGGLRVVSRGEALTMGLDAVVLTSSFHADSMWAASADLRSAGVRVVRVPIAG